MDDKESEYLTRKEFYIFIEKEIYSRKQVESNFFQELKELKFELKKTKNNILQWSLPFLAIIISLMIALLIK